MDPRLLVEFLAGLVRARKLGVEDVDVVWRENCERWIVDQRLVILEKGIRDGDVAVSHHDSFCSFGCMLMSFFDEGDGAG